MPRPAVFAPSPQADCRAIDFDDRAFTYAPPIHAAKGLQLLGVGRDVSVGLQPAGEPKRAMLTPANFCALIHVLNACQCLVRQAAAAAKRQNSGGVPLFLIFGLSCIMLLASANGTEIVLHLRIDSERMLADIFAEKITSFPGVPSMSTALINHPKFTEFDLSSVSMWRSGGAPLDVVANLSKKELAAEELAQRPSAPAPPSPRRRA